MENTNLKPNIMSGYPKIRELPELMEYDQLIQKRHSCLNTKIDCIQTLTTERLVAVAKILEQCPESLKPKVINAIFKD